MAFLRHMIKGLSRDGKMEASREDDDIETTPKEEEKESIRPVFTNGQLSIVGLDIEEIPTQLVEEYVEETTHFDLSFNQIRNLAGLEKFQKLKVLVLDNNEISDEVAFPHIDTLDTLFLNKNKICDLEQFLKQMLTSFPNLTYLSLLGNKACPNQLSSSEKDEEDYQRYRYYVLFRLPNLKFLDSSAVRLDELKEAKQRGQFMQVVRPTEDQMQKEGPEQVPQYTPLPKHTTAYDEEEKHFGRWGRSRSKYLGRNSEGNRFITDGVL